MFNVDYKKSFSILKLIHSYFLKNKIGLIISLVVPILFMIIFFSLASTLKPQVIFSVYGHWVKIDNYSYFTNSFPIFIVFGICPLSMLSIPNMNIEFRNSILLKNIKSNKVSKYQYQGIVFSYFLILSLILSIIILIVFLLFTINHYDCLVEFNWLTIFFGIISLIVVSITFSMFISNLIKSPIGAQLLNISIIILSIGLSGRLMNMALIDKIKP